MEMKTQEPEPKEPTWTEKLGIKDEKTRKLMEVAGQGLSIWMLLWLGAQAVGLIFILLVMAGFLFLFFKVIF